MYSPKIKSSSFCLQPLPADFSVLKSVIDRQPQRRSESKKEILASESTPRQKTERDQKPSIDCLPRENKGKSGGKEGRQKSERSATNGPAVAE